MKSWNLPARGLTGAAVALTALLTGSCDFGDPIVAKGTEVEGLTGTLVVGAGTPAVGAWVRVFPVSPTVLAKSTTGATGAGDATMLALDSMQATSSGFFQFKDLADGTYNIAATLVHGDTTFAVFLRGIVVVGNTHLGVDTLQMAGSLTLQALSGSTAVANALCAITGSPWQATSDASGTCVLTGVPPGTFQVTVTHPDYTLTISGDITVLSNLLATAGLLELTATSSPLPAAPLLVSPVSLSTVSTLQPVLIWRRAANAASYHVQLSTDSLFSTLILNDSGRVDTSRTTSPLATDTRYYWRVRARNTAGVSPWSARWSFTTSTPGTGAGAASLIAYWNFEDGSGTTLADRTGKGHTGTIQSGAWVDGIQGKALSFNGTSTRVTVPFAPDLNLRQFTLSAWVKTSRVGGQAILSRQTPYGQGAPWNYRFGLTEAAQISTGTILAGRALADFWPNNETGVIGTALVADGTWHHLVAVMEGTNLKMYLDGALHATKSMGLYPDTTSTQALWIGASAFSSGQYFQGVMDEVRIYNQPLSAAQVDSLYWLHAAGSGSTILIASQDAAITGSAPGYAAGTNTNLNYGKITTMAAGVYDLNTVARSLIQFEMPSGFTSANIASAVLRVYTNTWISKNVRPDSVRLYAHRLLRPWQEGNSGTGAAQNSASVNGVTALERFWGSQDGSEDWNQKIIGLDGVDAAAVASSSASKPRTYVGYWDFDLTALARIWADSPAQNFGIVLRSDIPASNALVEDYPDFHTKDAPVADSLKPRLILNGGGFSSSNIPVTVPLLPAAPVLVYPAQWDNGVPNPPTLTWNAVTGATSYQVQMATDSNFNAIIFRDTAVTATSRLVNGLLNDLLYSTEYYWRVRARNANGTGAWSSTYRFMTVTGGAGVLPTPIDILEPLQGAVNVPQQSSVYWGGGAGTIKLSVIQVALDSAFTQMVWNDSSKSSGYIVNAGTGSRIGRSMGTLAAGTTHFVRVILGNDAGVRVSETRRFTTAPAAGTGGTTAVLPTPINLVDPLHGATNVPRQSLVSWSGGSGTIKLKVIQVALDSTFTQLVTNDTDKYGGQGIHISEAGEGSYTGRSMGILAGGTTHFVRVILGNDAGVRVSETRRFTTVKWMPRYSNTTNALNTVIWNGSTFVTAGNAGTLLTSTDGSGWTARTSGTTTNLYAAASNGSVVVVVGAGGTIRTSTNNGATWIARTSGTASALYAVSWNGSQFVAGGAGGTLLTSTDGTTWTVRNSGTTNGIYAITSTGSQTVIAGANGMIRTSPDGVTWTARTAGVTGTIYALSWAGNVLAAAGANGVILTSANGTVWTQQVSGVTSALYSLAWNVSQRVAVGGNGIALTSSNGTTWTRGEVGVPEGMYSVTSNGSIFVTVGQIGHIMTMP